MAHSNAGNSIQDLQKRNSIMIPSTVARVPMQTEECINEQIRRQTVDNVARYRDASRAEIDQRLQELDEEWDIERTLEANASAVALVGLTLSLTADRKWIILPTAVAGFLFQHAIQGWCPPLPIFRRLGFRTASEIDEERYALKFLRNDFQDLSPFEEVTPEQLIEAVRR